MIEASALMGNAEMRHGFFTREGGRSSGIYAGLNCGLGSDDDRDLVSANRAHVATALGLLPDQLVTVHQVHSADVAVVDTPPDEAPRADALVTDKPGLALGILTADCAPVLFSDHRSEVIGAAHAGWRGALDGILEATIDAMIALGAARERITAVVGPTIQQHAYEVGPEFQERFVDAAESNTRFFRVSDKAGHFLFDLPGYVAARLTRQRVRQARSLELCTYSDADRFYSYRRATHHGEPDYGRQISAITLGPAAFDAGH